MLKKLFFIGIFLLIIVHFFFIKPALNAASSCLIQDTVRTRETTAQAQRENWDKNKICESSTKDLQILDSCLKEVGNKQYLTPLLIKLSGQEKTFEEIGTTHMQVCEDHRNRK